MLLENRVVLVTGGTSRIGRATAELFAKAGLLGMTRNLALDYAPTVRVNAVLPGPIVTGLWKDMTDKEIQKSADSVPLKRNGTPEDVAKVALFLASDLSSYVTGTEVVVDGDMISGLKFP